MPPVVAQSGHGMSIAVNSVATPLVFTEIASVDNDIVFGFMRGETEVTPHSARIDHWVTDGRMQRDAIPFSVTYVVGTATQDAILDAFLDKVTLGYRLRGPGVTDSSDELIISGEVTNFKRTNPARSGAQRADFTLRPSGPMWWRGELIDGFTD